MNKLDIENLHIAAKNFAEENEKHWEHDLRAESSKGWIYVLHTLPNDLISCVHENIVAKGIQEKFGLPIVSVISGKANTLTDLVDASFAIHHRFHSSYHEYDNAQIQAAAKKICAETYGKPDQLLDLSYKGIQVGDAIYDDILRRGNTGKCGEVFECFDISLERYYVFIRNALAVVDAAFEMFQKGKPSYLIVTDYVYTKGLYTSVAKSLGAKIIITQTETPDMPIVLDPKCFRQETFKCSYVRKIQMENCAHIASRVSTETDDLFVVKSEKNKRKDLLEPLGVKKEYKNVFILPHALCDAPREACKHFIYRDYCEWFKDTINIIRNVPGVNWIIKDHPYASYYGQDIFCKKIFEENRTENMYWLDNGTNGMQVKDVADCIITCAGDAGIEYWAYGIPTITTEEAYYCNWGISYRASSREEYENILKHINELKEPTEQSRELARKCLTSFKEHCESSDVFARALSDFSKKIWAIRRVGHFSYGISELVDGQINCLYSDFLIFFVQLLQENSLKDSTIFTLKNMVLLE